MKPTLLTRSLTFRALFAVTALCSLCSVCLPAAATPLMEMRIENLLPMAPDFKTSLALTPNQQTLWQQVESRSRAIVRERQSRREHLQRAVATALEGKSVELRELSAPLDAELATTMAEEKQLRELWLGLNDALDEKQRQMVVTLLAEQMMKVNGDGEHERAQRPEGRVIH
ncbi:MAG: hypothetical protein ABIT83_09720 [Massilia sp.]